mgnify:CR=1 FL=1
MADIGTYSSTIYPFTPTNILPEPGDIITWDWMDAVGIFSQRALRIATMALTAFPAGSQAIFNFSSLKCDNHPPYLKAYVKDGGVWKSWDSWIPGSVFTYPNHYIQFIQIGLGSARFFHETNANRDWFLIAYL